MADDPLPPERQEADVDPEGRYADEATLRRAPVLLCLQCGCWVGDRSEHDAWHYDTEVGADEWP